MPLLPFSVMRNSVFNSKSSVSPPRQMMNELFFSTVSGVIWPTRLPPSTDQYAVSPSQPCNDSPSNMLTKPSFSGLLESTCALSVSDAAPSFGLQPPVNRMIASMGTKKQQLAFFTEVLDIVRYVY